MASITMTSTLFLGGAVASTISKPHASTRGVIVVKASRVPQGETNVEIKSTNKEESNNGRRELMFAAAAAAACSIAKVAMADDEPKRGSAEARKKYSPVCVTMPTARICHQ